MRAVGYALPAILILAFAAATAFAGDLRIVAWNLEHLDDADGEGCVGRKAADYAVLARRIAGLDADVVAFQEVENAAAASRVFPASDWHVEVSGRPPMARSRACWDRPEARLGHLATGFAVRRGLAYRRNPDLKVLGAGAAFQRWGADITVTAGGDGLRLLSVHLRSGLLGRGAGPGPEAEQDLRGAPVPDRAPRNLGRRAPGGEHALRHPGRFQPAAGAARRLGVRRLSPKSAPLLLLTEGVPFRCDPRFPAFIDHLVAGGGAERMRVRGSFREWPRRGRHPDHCALSADFRLGP